MLGRGFVDLVGAGGSVGARVSTGGADTLAVGDGEAVGDATGETAAAWLVAGAAVHAETTAARPTSAVTRRNIAIRAIGLVSARFRLLALARPYCPVRP